MPSCGEEFTSGFPLARAWAAALRRRQQADAVRRERAQVPAGVPGAVQPHARLLRQGEGAGTARADAGADRHRLGRAPVAL